MADNYSIKPRLGKIGNTGAGTARKLTSQIRKVSAILAKQRRSPSFTGERIGRGTAAAAASQFRNHPFAKHRMRRVVVKTHIARANKGIGKAAFKAHLHYIQRDGVEQDGSGGELYDRDNNKIDDKDFLKRSEDDRHQFRVIVSPEDGSKLDLKLNTRAFMSQMERDLGTKLDWVAVDHHNTGNPHTHIVIRGKDERGKDLIIARDYITKAMRRLASETVTKQLGPRRDMEIAQAQAREVEQERFTGIDRRLERLARDNEIKVSSANTAYDRFERTLAIRRLGELQRMGLAKPTGKQSWQLKPGWQDKLKDMGKRGDIIRSISASMGKENAPDRLSLFDATAPDQKPVLGKIVSGW